MEEEKQLTQGVRCSHVYLLSTLEDSAVKSFITSDQFKKTSQQQTLEAILPFLLPKDSHGALTGYS